MDGRKRIAKITGTTLGWEDHGIFTGVLYLDYGDSGQGAGLYALDTYDKEQDRRVGVAEGMEFIIRTLRACGVSRWEDLVGRTIYAWQDDGKVYGIGPLETDPGETFEFASVWNEVKV